MLAEGRGDTRPLNFQRAEGEIKARRKEVPASSHGPFWASGDDGPPGNSRGRQEAGRSAWEGAGGPQPAHTVTGLAA